MVDGHGVLGVFAVDDVGHHTQDAVFEGGGEVDVAKVSVDDEGR